jgi:hypothetical protein
MQHHVVWINSSVLFAVGAISFSVVLWSDHIPWINSGEASGTSKAATYFTMPSTAKSAAWASASRGQTAYVIRSTVKTLSDATRTGNYSVLRDLAAAKFRERYSTAQLSAIFGPLRNLPIDLAQAALSDPVFSIEPLPGSGGDFRVTGHFATAPVRVAFTMEFSDSDGHWKLANIDVLTQALQASL